MSEHKAEATYGPAPVGDEDPHTSQAVPDPGDVSSYRGWTGMSAGALDSTHLGLQVRITDTNGFGIQGMLVGIEHHCDLIHESSLFGETSTSTSMGRKWVIVEFAPYGATRVTPEARVEFLK